MRTPTTSLCWIAMFLAIGSTASAAPIRIEFQGTLQNISSGLRDGSLQLGQALSGYVEFDADLATSVDVDSNSAFYRNAVTGYGLQIGSVAYSFSPGISRDNLVFVQDNTFRTDTFYARTPVSGTLLNGLSAESAQFGLSSFPDTTVLSGVEIPTDEEFSSFNQFQRDLNFMVFDANRLDWLVNEFTVIPEPSSAVLLALGLTALGARGSRARQRARS